MTIIIETPAPPVRERLVLVPVGETHAHCRDATPEDLERAGYVLESGANTIVEEHLARAERAERERDDLLEGDMREARTQRERADQAAALRAELARLTAPAEGEMPPPDGVRVLSSGLTEAVEVELMGVVDAAIGRLDDYGSSLVCRGSASGVAHTVALDAYRLGVAHERARQQPAQDRATDEELERVYSNAYARAWESELSTPDRGERAGLRAVAARVRQERCLIARAVAAETGAHFYPYADSAGTDGSWLVYVMSTYKRVPAAEVPATLARLLGEVSR